MIYLNILCWGDMKMNCGHSLNEHDNVYSTKESRGPFLKRYKVPSYQHLSVITTRDVSKCKTHSHRDVLCSYSTLLIPRYCVAPVYYVES